MTPAVVLIAAVARDGAIGRDNALPWHLPEDLAHFRRQTQGAPVVMGRHTWDSLPPKFRPLPGRRNLVVTRQPDWQAAGAERAGSLAAAVALAGDAPRVFVIGGAMLYRQALPMADELVLTEVDHAYPDADAHFPPWERAAYDEVSREAHAPDGGRPGFAFVHYRRRAAPPPR